MGKFLSPRNDFAFKRIFGSERYKDILIHFLNDIFARQTNPIQKVTFLKPDQDPAILAERKSIVDVLCEDTDRNKFIIEMQINEEKGFIKRAQYYAAKAYIDQRDKGIKYRDLKEVTFLAITNHVLFPDKKNYLSHHAVLDKESLEHDLHDFSFSFLELPKFTKNADALYSMTEKWAYFFKNADFTNPEEVDKIAGTDFVIREAYDALDKFGWSKEELMTYQSVDMKQCSTEAQLELAMEKGMEKGIEKGEKRKALEIARSMLSKQIPIETIVEITGLTAVEIQEKLQKQAFAE